MGTSCTKNSTHPSSNPSNDQSSYLLDQNRLQSSYDPHSTELNFIPDSEQQWNSTVPLHIPQSISVIERSKDLDYLNPMPIQQKFRCDQCGMAFPSDESLFKHKTRFCIGVKDSGINRHPVYSDDEDYVNQSKRTITQKVVQHQTPIEKVCL